ncbi:MAG: response regulator transcription factor [Paludibacteraceae bacterium]|nr:response regulator transcription factor [Paludibacteraceae bacterium]
MAKQRILIVDDEEDICMILSYSLQKAGYEVLVAHSAEEALELLQSPNSLIASSPIDLILLDIMMGEMSGLEMAEKLRSDIGRSHGELLDASLLDIGTPPIIFLTALSDEDTVLQGFQLGADDYISKPFRIAEVLARVAAVLRRTEASRREGDEVIRQEGENCIVFEGIVVNKADMSLKVDGEAVVMTRKEIELLCYLLTHRGQILSREHLLKNVWDSNGFVMERTVDVHITHLRKKLGQYGKRIITKSGYGYMFSV